MSSQINKTSIALAEKGYIPDKLLRLGIRQLLSHRLEELTSATYGDKGGYIREFIKTMNGNPIAQCTDDANDQHYEIPPRFFEIVLGSQLKYSCGHWAAGTTDLNTAETSALRETCKRAALKDGMDILELGCGWGSLSLWMARHFPNAQITAVSNSASQGEYIRRRAEEAAVTNLRVITADMNELVDPDSAFNNRLIAENAFDRVVSVEMFEHMSNWPRAFDSVHRWLRPGGQFFMHVFCHRTTPYTFEDEGDDDWMARHFFSGGIMPCDNLPLHIASQTEGLALNDHWRWYGDHYAKTADAWLANMDEHKAEIMELFDQTYGEDASIWWNRWRLFFMACSELFNWRGGREWWVGHYLIQKQTGSQQGIDSDPEAA